MQSRMRDFPSRRPSWSLTAALTALLGLAVPAAAQIGPPLRLVPAPAPGTGPAIPDREPPPPPTTLPPGQAVEEAPLPPVDEAWRPAPGELAFALPADLWRGTPRALAAAALTQLAPTTSPGLQRLERRLLRSGGSAPVGRDPSGGPSLAELRIQKLAALGAVEEALALVAELPGPGETRDRLHAELLFAANDADGACREIADAIARYHGLWWDRALIACQALAGHDAEAALGLGLLREGGAPPDPVFTALIDAVGGHPAALGALPEPTPLTVTLLAAAKRPLPAEAVAAADLLSLRAWIGTEAVPPEQRLAAAERAAALGALSPEGLAALYATVEFKPEELGAAIKQGLAPATPRDRALLFAVARTDPADPVRAAAVASLLTEARRRGVFVLTARIVGPLLHDLAPSPGLARFAPQIWRALYAAGRPEAATPWLLFDDTSMEAGEVLPLLRLMQGKPTSALVDGALAAAITTLPPRQAMLMLTVFNALGEPVAAADIAPLIAERRDGMAANAALWLDQQQAAAGKRVGETVLTTLLLAADGDRLSGDPIVLGRAIAGLAAVGLAAEARALAVEAALDAGL
jgi:hypothetical protein